MKFTCKKCNEKVSVEKQLMLDQTPLVDLKYELYGVIVHTSLTSTCGHYYCYIRYGPDTWYKFDDSKVTKVSEEHVLSEEAYILFYTKQNTACFSNFMKTCKLSLHPNSSNTSPKSVLDNWDRNSTSPYSLNKAFHGENRTSKAQDTIFPESFYGITTKNTIVPLGPKKFYGANSPSRFEVPKNSGVSVTPTRRDRLEVTDLKDDDNRVFTTPVSRPSNSCGERSTFDVKKVLSPSTPSRSLDIDVSHDENSEVVFAPKPEKLKSVEKTPIKRPRNKDVDDPIKLEALRRCKKMPGSRGSLVMTALDVSSKNKISKKTISHNLATSSFR